MSVLGKLFGSSERAPELWPPKPGKSTFADAVPGKVTVQFFAHDEVEGFSGNFLTAVTDGLLKRRQRELVFSLRLAAGDDPTEKMRDLTRFVGTVYAWAREGNFVNPGELTQFGARGLFGRADSGLIYIDARPIRGVEVPERALAAIIVDAAEIRAAIDYGAFRVLTRLGAGLRLFPYPTWNDLERESVATSREAESLLAKVARVRAPDVFFIKTEARLQVSLPYDPTKLLRDLRALPPGAPFALLTMPAPMASAILTWSPGQEGPSGISADGSDSSSMSGSCLKVVPGKQADQIRPFEDGYAVLFSSESWGLLFASLSVQRPFSAKMAGGLRFDVIWREDPRLSVRGR
jgi:hypothetical protein